jgi:hypothetical protein
MIKYTKEEFPLRFQAFEHTCKYCGVTFYSNRRRTQYDTGTCRAKAWQEKKENQPLSSKKKSGVVEFIDFDRHPILASDVWSKYFPELLYREVFDNLLIKTGGNDKYYFQLVTADMVKQNKDKYPKTGILVFAK